MNVARSVEAPNGLLCPVCKSHNLQTISSRHRLGMVVRVKACEKNHRFTTEEEVARVLAPRRTRKPL